MITFFGGDKRRDLRKLARTGQALRRVGQVVDLDVEGIGLNVWQDGEGEAGTVVFLHGNSACKEVFFPQFEALHGQALRLVAFDLPGHGLSSDAALPHDVYTISAYARLMERALQQLEVVKPVLVGWSLGGHVAIEMAGRGADLAAIVLSGTPPAGPGLAEIADAFTPSPHMAVTTQEKASARDIELYVDHLYHCLERIPNHFLRAALRTDGRARRIVGEHWASGEEGCHQKTVIASWEQPICVIQGREEPFFSNSYLSALHWARLWRGQVFEIDGAGHAPFLERPDRYNEILQLFLADVFCEGADVKAWQSRHSRVSGSG